MNINQIEASRKKSLGELGELFAIKALVDKGFDKIRNLNDQKMNETFADLLCEKDNKKYIISVKARNKFQKDGTVNNRYNLGKDVRRKADSSQIKHNAVPHWMAIQFDQTSFSIFFGSLSELGESNAIPIQKCENQEVGEIWEHNKRHYFDFSFYSNSKEEDSLLLINIKS